MRLLTLPFVLLLAVAPATAEELPPAGRYTFVPAEEGALRLDAETGEVSLCNAKTGALTCVRVMGEAGPPASALAERIAALEARVAALEAAQAVAGEALSEEEAIDRVMTLTERMMGRFFAMVRDMKRQSGREDL